jgi:hypothetical protein
MNATQLFQQILSEINQYGIYRQPVHGGIADEPAFVFNLLSYLFLNLPFELLQVFVLVVTLLQKLLDISGALTPLEAGFWSSAQALFLNFIGGKDGAIAATSSAATLVIVMGVYLAYQYFKGQGHFLESLLHLLAVVGVMFFFFGSFTVTARKAPQGGFYGNFTLEASQKSEIGGEIAFSTLQNVSGSIEASLQKSLTGYTGVQSSDFLVSYVLVPAANYVNTGNPAGTLPDGSTFDYSAAKSGTGVGGYVDTQGGSDTFLQNNGDELGFQALSLVLEFANLLFYALPVLLLSLVTSILSLLFSLFIFLLPVSAILSFIPLFQNAFYTTLKKMAGFLLAPFFLAFFLGLYFYLMSLVDKGVLWAVTGTLPTNTWTALSPLSGLLYLAAVVAIILLKLFFTWVIWHYRDSLTQMITGGDTTTQNILNTMEAHRQVATNKIEGAALLGAGYIAGSSELAMQGASMLAPKMHQGYQKRKSYFDTFMEKRERQTGGDANEQDAQERSPVSETEQETPKTPKGEVQPRTQVILPEQAETPEPLTPTQPLITPPIFRKKNSEAAESADQNARRTQEEEKSRGVEPIKKEVQSEAIPEELPEIPVAGQSLSQEEKDKAEAQRTQPLAEEEKTATTSEATPEGAPEIPVAEQSLPQEEKGKAEAQRTQPPAEEKKTVTASEAIPEELPEIPVAEQSLPQEFSGTGQETSGLTKEEARKEQALFPSEQRGTPTDEVSTVEEETPQKDSESAEVERKKGATVRSLTHEKTPAFTPQEQTEKHPSVLQKRSAQTRLDLREQTQEGAEKEKVFKEDKKGEVPEEGNLVFDAPIFYDAVKEKQESAETRKRWRAAFQALNLERGTSQ